VKGVCVRVCVCVFVCVGISIAHMREKYGSAVYVTEVSESVLLT